MFDKKIFLEELTAGKISFLRYKAHKYQAGQIFYVSW